MGWTLQCAKFYDRKGNIDRKAECDDLYTWNNEETGDKCRVLKSTMVGATWYGACERSRPGQEPYVFAGVCLTSVDRHAHFDFGYKDMDESVGPMESSCPVSILRLLSPTEHEYALSWRERCRENAACKAAERKDQNSLANLPLGSAVTVEKNGEEILLQKAIIRGRKKPVWVSWQSRTYYTAAQVKEHGYTLYTTA